MASSHSTSTTSVAQSWSSRTVALSALFVALSLVLSFVEFPIFPAAPYLKYDPSGIVGLIAGLAFGPSVGAIVAVLPWLVHLFVEPFGAIMALFCSLASVLPAAFIYRALPTNRGLILALCVAAVVTLAAAIVGNLVITPLYSGVSMADVATLIVPVLLPFNLLKILINSVVAAAALLPVKSLARAQR